MTTSAIFLHKFVTVYLDDVCLYNRTLEEYMEHLRFVLQRFKEEGLKLRLKKCLLGFHVMEYLGYNVSIGTISVSTKKVEAVTIWRVHATQEVRSFVQFCNFYAKLIHHFSDLTAPLTDLLRSSEVLCHRWLRRRPHVWKPLRLSSYGSFPRLALYPSRG
jgi:hypothetical protein